MNSIVLIFIFTSSFISNNHCRKIRVEGKARICQSMQSMSVNAAVFSASMINSNHKNEEQCVNKLILNVDIDTAAIHEPYQESIQLGSVVDEKAGSVINLADPIRLDVSFKPLTEVYDLNFLHLVNGEVTEVIASKEQSNFLCGYNSEDGYLMSFSQGFTCSCDDIEGHGLLLARAKSKPTPGLNNTSKETDWTFLMRQPLSKYSAAEPMTSREFTRKRELPLPSSPNVDDRLTSYSLLDQHNFEEDPFLDDDQEAKSKLSFAQQDEQLWVDINGNTTEESDRIMQAPTVLAGCDEVLSGVSGVYIDFPDDVSRRTFCREAIESRRDKRCLDDPRPPTPRPRVTTHCIRLSQLWYAVYSLGPAKVQRSVTVTVLQRHGDDWQAMSNVSQRSNPSHLQPYSLLDPTRSRLLVPLMVEGVDPDKFPELSGSSRELMVLDVEQLSDDGSECNKAGTGFEAFATQLARCFAPAGSCVEKNQPRQLRREDELNRQKGKAGFYMLDNFASLPKQPLHFNSVTGKWQLEIYPAEPRLLREQVELPMPFTIDGLMQMHAAQLTRISADARGATGSVMVNVATRNRGPDSLHLMVRVTSCGEVTCTQIAPTRLMLTPGETRVEKFGLRCVPSPVMQFKCKVEVVKEGCKQVLARREFAVMVGSTCECKGLCSCVCNPEGNPNTLTKHQPCKALPESELQAAGFLLVPIVSRGPLNLGSFFSTPFIQFLIILVLMMVLGTLKAVVGLMGCQRIELFGLCTFLHHFMPFVFTGSTQDWGIIFVLNAHIILLSPFLLLHWIFCHCCQCNNETDTDHFKNETIMLSKTLHKKNYYYYYYYDNLHNESDTEINQELMNTNQSYEKNSVYNDFHANASRMETDLEPIENVRRYSETSSFNDTSQSQESDESDSSRIITTLLIDYRIRSNATIHTQE